MTPPPSLLPPLIHEERVHGSLITLFRAEKGTKQCSYGLGKRQIYKWTHQTVLFNKNDIYVLIEDFCSKECGWLLHCNENAIYVFLFWELHLLSPNFHIHVSVSDLYISRIGPHIWLQQNRQTNPGNVLVFMSVGIGRENIIILFWKYCKEAAHFHFWEYINGNKTFILDSHRPFICNVVRVQQMCRFSC